MRWPTILPLLVLLAVTASEPGRAAPPEATVNAYEFSFPGIDGEALPLAKFRGSPLLVVNTASRCGFTGQYDGLQKLWSRYRRDGLVVIGAPSNDFNQELADRAAVKAFCTINFAIDFPMTDIVSVKGPSAHPFFAWAAERTRAPQWNFNKYLIDKDGAVLRHYPASTRPQRIAEDIEALIDGRTDD